MLAGAVHQQQHRMWCVATFCFVARRGMPQSVSCQIAVESWKRFEAPVCTGTARSALAGAR